MEDNKPKETKENENQENKTARTELIEAPEDTQLQKIPDFQNLWQLAEGFHKSNLFKQTGNAYGIMVIVEYGRELGIQPIMALQTMSIIKGNICIESKALLAQALSKGIKVKIDKKTKDGSTITFQRPGQDSFTETFTMDDAKRIGLAYKDNWKQYPEEMCYWRCIAKGLRAYAPDVLLGLYTKEEVQDFGTGGAFGHAEKISIKKEEYQEEKEKPEPKKETKAKAKPKTTKKSTKKSTKKETKPDLKVEPPPKESTQNKEDSQKSSSDEKEEIAGWVKDYVMKRYKTNKELEYKNFKQYLNEYQMEHKDRKYVDVHFGNLSLRAGELKSLRILKKNIDVALKKFEAWKEELAESGIDIKTSLPFDEEIPF